MFTQVANHQETQNCGRIGHFASRVTSGWSIVCWFALHDTIDTPSFIDTIIGCFVLGIRLSGGYRWHSLSIWCKKNGKVTYTPALYGNSSSVGYGHISWKHAQIKELAYNRKDREQSYNSELQKCVCVCECAHVSIHAMQL